MKLATFFQNNWPLLFSMACILLCHSRNLIIFEGNATAHSFLACKVVKLAKDYENNLNMIAIARAKVPTVVTTQVSWNLPPQKLAKAKHKWFFLAKQIDYCVRGNHQKP